METKLVDPLDSEGKKCFVCTPCEQTKELQALGGLTAEQCVDLFQHNLFTSEGRIEFVKKYNALALKGGNKKMKWTQSNEDELNKKYGNDVMAVFLKFFAFKAKFDKVSTIMISMIEGNHRLLCLLFTLAGRKVNQLCGVLLHEPQPKEKLTLEYLEKVGKHMNGSFLDEEGDTWLMKQVEEFMTSDTVAMMVNMNMSVPLVPNSEVYPVTELLEWGQEESRKYTEAKKESSEKSVFVELSEIIGDGYQMKDGVPGEKYTNRRVVSDVMVVGDGVEVDLTPKKGEEEAWVGKIMANLTVEAAKLELGLQHATKGNGEWVTTMYPWPQERYRQMAKGGKAKTELGELRLIIVGRRVLEFCMTKYGDSPQDAKDATWAKILRERLMNYSIDRRWMKLGKMGDDANRGLAAGAFVLSLFTVGGLFDKRVEVYDFIRTLGFAHHDQKQYWTGLSK